MIEIKDLLSRFNNILLSTESKKESVRVVVSEILGVEIKSDQIEIKNNIIYLNIKPIYKNEILLKRDKIMARLQEEVKGNPPEDIR